MIEPSNATNFLTRSPDNYEVIGLSNFPFTHALQLWRIGQSLLPYNYTNAHFFHSAKRTGHIPCIYTAIHFHLQFMLLTASRYVNFFSYFGSFLAARNE